jgi:hypothetical protein
MITDRPAAVLRTRALGLILRAAAGRLHAHIYACACAQRADIDAMMRALLGPRLAMVPF